MSSKKPLLYNLLVLYHFYINIIQSMGGGPLPTPATTTGNHHSQPPYLPTVSPFSSMLFTRDSDFIHESEDMAIGYSNQINFGHVPSQMEVQNAINDLQRVMNGFCVDDSSRSVMKSVGQKRLLDAYHLLQTDPFVQVGLFVYLFMVVDERLVLSISSDTQVWDAILKNDAVLDLQSSLPLADEECETYKHEPNSTSAIVKWIFAVMKSKIIELMEKLEVFVFETLYSRSKKTSSESKHDDVLEEKVRSSLLLSIVVLLIVVVTRSLET
ncbi:hypothetical protein M8C21_019493 [Ambrosia artemisiifolia]|uniref:Uncharacterized protein n=1 Tax=Ambrosia artemisiifolia TaxID=4212 RepID=A0AAD5CGS5_AMBAR|nr:hypothetical protein M8C21_019493 [Ambrosia artemisiifolia]